MGHQQLQAELVNRFHVTHTEAERMIREQEGRALVKAAVARARAGGVQAAPDPNFEEPGAWRQEVQRRMLALDVLEEGVKALEKMHRLIKRVIDLEKRLIQTKRAKIKDKQTDWWDFQHSGWAMGGREMFAQLLNDLLRNLDEQRLAGQVMDRIGFKRTVPLPELPVEPVELMPTAAPRNDIELEAALVKGAKHISTEGRLVRAGHGIGREKKT
jgi:hypothetical protein